MAAHRNRSKRRRLETACRGSKISEPRFSLKPILKPEATREHAHRVRCELDTNIPQHTPPVGHEIASSRGPDIGTTSKCAWTKEDALFRWFCSCWRMPFFSEAFVQREGLCLQSPRSNRHLSRWAHQVVLPCLERVNEARSSASKIAFQPRRILASDQETSRASTISARPSNA